MTIGEMKKEYGVDFGGRSDMKLSTYLKKIGLSSMSRSLKELEEYKKKLEFSLKNRKGIK